MSAFLSLDSVSARAADQRLLFEGLTLSLGAERVGLVGRNGAGKSTLLRMIAGEAQAASGVVHRAGSVGLLAQDWPDGMILADALGVRAAMVVVARVLAGDGDAADLDAVDWTVEARVETALVQAGLPAMALDRPMASLSGGERMRVGIARLLISQPDLLLLDEPTNNLDADGRAAVHALIHGWRGGVLVASHDRDLLEAMDRIVELTPVGVRIVGGGWSAFAEVREGERVRVAAELERSRAGLRDAERTAQRQREAKERRDRAGRAFAAKGAEPRIVLGAQAQRAENSGGRAHRLGERRTEQAAAELAQARSRIEVVTPLSIDLPASGVASDARLLTIEAVSVMRGARRLGPWTLHLSGPERIAVTGANGAGKTTLLKIAAGVIEPDAGGVQRADGRIAIVDQHVGLLDRAASILANFRRLNPEIDEQGAHAACARFAFRNRDAARRVGTLSGGERLRAGLACVLSGARPPWLLILDEPTNHLDIESIELLERALRAFDGGLMVVSHDRAFLDAIGVGRTFDVGRT